MKDHSRLFSVYFYRTFFNVNERIVIVQFILVYIVYRDTGPVCWWFWPSFHLRKIISKNSIISITFGMENLSIIKYYYFLLSEWVGRRAFQWIEIWRLASAVTLYSKTIYSTHSIRNDLKLSHQSYSVQMTWRI